MDLSTVATIHIFWSNQWNKSTNYKTRMDPRDLQNIIILYCDYIIQDSHKKQKKTHPSESSCNPLDAILLFPMCTKPRGRYQNSVPPNQRNISRLASRSNCTHLKEISPPQYHIYIDNTFRACGKDSPDKKPRARLIYITIRVNQI